MSQKRARRASRRTRLLAGALAIASLVALDISTAPLFPGAKDAQLAVSGDTATAQRLLLVFPGYAADCQSIKTSFESHLQLDEALVVVCYPTENFTDEQVFKAVQPLVEHNSSAKIVALAGSMGGLVAIAYLSRLSREQWSSPPRDVRLVLDTCPAGPEYLRVPASVLAVANWYPGGGISSLAWAALHMIPHELPTSEPAGDDAAIQQGNTYNQWIGTAALVAQARYINSFRLGEHHFTQPPKRTVYVEASQSDLDPLVQVSPSLVAWAQTFPEMNVRVLPNRRGEWHIPWTYRPDEIMSVVQDISN